jgi:hypothetical protein
LTERSLLGCSNTRPPLHCLFRPELLVSAIRIALAAVVTAAAWLARAPCSVAQRLARLC